VLEVRALRTWLRLCQTRSRRFDLDVPFEIMS
jgi:hypothetical protein